MSGGRLRRSAPHAALLVGSTLFSLFLMEVCLRTLDIGPNIYLTAGRTFRLSDNPVLGYELAPGAPDGLYVINGFGMRDRDYTLDKPRDVYRIAVLGDSIAYGWQVERDEGFAAELERLLNRDASTRYQVLNFGVTGYNATQVAENLRSRALRFDPDLVVYVYCLNDAQVYSTEMARLQAQRPGVRPSRWTESTLAWIRRFRVGLLALRGYRSVFQSEAPSPSDVPVSEDPQYAALDGGTYAQYFHGLHTERGGWGRVRDAIRSMRVTTDVPIVVVVFPLLEDLPGYPLEAVHQLIERELRSEGVAVLDLLAAFRRADGRGQKLSLDALHPSRRGHELAARHVHAFLARGPLR